MDNKYDQQTSISCNRLVHIAYLVSQCKLVSGEGLYNHELQLRGKGFSYMKIT